MTTTIIDTTTKGYESLSYTEGDQIKFTNFNGDTISYTAEKSGDNVVLKTSQVKYYLDVTVESDGTVDGKTVSAGDYELELAKRGEIGDATYSGKYLWRMTPSYDSEGHEPYYVYIDLTESDFSVDSETGAVSIVDQAFPSPNTLVMKVNGVMEVIGDAEPVTITKKYYESIKSKNLDARSSLNQGLYEAQKEGVSATLVNYATDAKKDTNIYVNGDSSTGTNLATQLYDVDMDSTSYNGSWLNEKITGTSGNDTIYGGAGDDTIYSGAGDDNIYGGEGNDTIRGGAGIDHITGGAGNDILYGGEGNTSDHFYYGAASSGDDVIMDDQSADYIHFDNYTFENANIVLTRNSEHKLVISYNLGNGDSGTIKLTNFDFSETNGSRNLFALKFSGGTIKNIFDLPINYTLANNEEFDATGAYKYNLSLADGATSASVSNLKAGSNLNIGSSYTLNRTASAGTTLAVKNGDKTINITGYDFSAVPNFTVNGNTSITNLNVTADADYVASNNYVENITVSGQNRNISGMSTDDNLNVDGDITLKRTNDSNTLVIDGNVEVNVTDFNFDNSHNFKLNNTLLSTNNVIDVTLTDGHAYTNTNYIEKIHGIGKVGASYLTTANSDELTISGTVTYERVNEGSLHVKGSNGDDIEVIGFSFSDASIGNIYVNGSATSENTIINTTLNSDLSGTYSATAYTDYIAVSADATINGLNKAKDKLYIGNLEDELSYSRTASNTNLTITDGDVDVTVGGFFNDNNDISVNNHATFGSKLNVTADADYIASDNYAETITTTAGVSVSNLKDVDTLSITGLAETSTYNRDMSVNSGAGLTIKNGDTTLVTISDYNTKHSFSGLSVDGKQLVVTNANSFNASNDGWEFATFNITGTSAADTIYGGAGADTISGNTGADTITGNGGNDTFVFNTGDGADSITDANSGDILKFADKSYQALSYAKRGVDLEIAYSETDKVVIDDFFATEKASRISDLYTLDDNVLTHHSIDELAVFDIVLTADAKTFNKTVSGYAGYKVNISLYGDNDEGFVSGLEAGDNITLANGKLSRVYVGDSTSDNTLIVSDGTNTINVADFTFDGEHDIKVNGTSTLGMPLTVDLRNDDTGIAYKGTAYDEIITTTEKGGRVQGLSANDKVVLDGDVKLERFLQSQSNTLKVSVYDNNEVQKHILINDYFKNSSYPCTDLNGGTFTAHKLYVSANSDITSYTASSDFEEEITLKHNISLYNLEARDNVIVDGGTLSRTNASNDLQIKAAGCNVVIEGFNFDKTKDFKFNGTSVKDSVISVTLTGALEGPYNATDYAEKITTASSASIRFSDITAKGDELAFAQDADLKYSRNGNDLVIANGNIETTVLDYYTSGDMSVAGVYKDVKIGNTTLGALDVTKIENVSYFDSGIWSTDRDETINLIAGLTTDAAIDSTKLEADTDNTVKANNTTKKYEFTSNVGYGTHNLDSYGLGRDGEDIINGTTGNDYIHGGAAADAVFGGEGAVGTHDMLAGGKGDDMVVAGKLATSEIEGAVKVAEDTYAVLSNGTAELYGDDGDDILVGGKGNDYLWGGAGHNTLTGGAGADTFDFTAREGGVFDTITDATKDDTIAIYGPNFKDMKFERGTGEQVNDLIITVVGEGEGIGTGDTLTVKGYFAQEEADRVTKFRVGGELYNLEWKYSNVDRAYHMYNVTHNPNGAAVEGIRNWINGYYNGNVEITGASAGDMLAGSIKDDTITAGNGGAELYGDKGNDTLIGGAGADYIRGKEGNDTLTGNGGADVFVIDSGVDTIKDASSSDVIRFTDTYRGDISDMTITRVAGTNNIEIAYGEGTDKVVVENFFDNENAINKFITLNKVSGETVETEHSIKDEAVFNVVLENGELFNKPESEYAGYRVALSGNGSVTGLGANDKIATSGQTVKYMRENAGGLIVCATNDGVQTDKITVTDFDFSDASTGNINVNGVKTSAETEILTSIKTSGTYTGSAYTDIVSVSGTEEDPISVNISGLAQNDSLTVSGVQSRTWNGVDNNKLVVKDSENNATVTITDYFSNPTKAYYFASGNLNVTLANTDTYTTPYIANDSFEETISGTGYVVGFNYLKDKLAFGSETRYTFGESGLTVSDPANAVTLYGYSIGTEPNVYVNDVKDQISDKVLYVEKRQTFDATSTLFAYKNVEITGTEYNDIYKGSAKDDIISGGAGADTIYGGAGNDEIYGSAGNDEIYGGAGANTFVFNAGDGEDKIIGANSTDIIKFADKAYTDLTFIKNGDHLDIKYGDNDKIVVNNFFKEQPNVNKVVTTDGKHTIVDFDYNLSNNETVNASLFPNYNMNFILPEGVTASISGLLDRHKVSVGEAAFSRTWSAADKNKLVITGTADNTKLTVTDFFDGDTHRQFKYNNTKDVVKGDMAVTLASGDPYVFDANFSEAISGVGTVSADKLLSPSEGSEGSNDYLSLGENISYTRTNNGNLHVKNAEGSDIEVTGFNFAGGKDIRVNKEGSTAGMTINVELNSELGTNTYSSAKGYAECITTNSDASIQFSTEFTGTDTLKFNTDYVAYTRNGDNLVIINQDDVANPIHTTILGYYKSNNMADGGNFPTVNVDLTTTDTTLGELAVTDIENVSNITGTDIGEYFELVTTTGVIPQNASGDFPNYNETTGKYKSNAGHGEIKIDAYAAGMGGDDYIKGTDGNDWINGGDGGDIIYGGIKGKDMLAGGNGENLILAGDFGGTISTPNTDGVEIYGGKDKDTIYVGGNNETENYIWAHGGDDEIHLYGGKNIIMLAEDDKSSFGNDVIYGATANDTLKFVSKIDADTTVGYNVADMSFAKVENDLVITVAKDGVNNKVTLKDYFANGNRPTKFITLDGELNLQWLHSNIKNDDAMYNVTHNPNGVAVAGIRNWIDGQVTTADGVTIKGKDQYDMLAGTGNGDTIYAGANGAELYGDKGNDTLIGGAGADYIRGKEGNDNLTGNGGADVFAIDSGNDVITDATSADVIKFVDDYRNDFTGITFAKGEGEKSTSLMVSFGENSSVEIQNYFNADGTVAENHVNKFAIVTEQAGTKEYTLDWMHSNVENADYMYNVTSNTEKNLVEGIRNWVDGYTTEVVSITGKSAGDMLAGSIKDDTITASDGGAELYGDKGNDTLIGGAGADYIRGKEGNDNLTGNGGADVFAIDSGNDVITDATSADVIKFVDDYRNDFTGITFAKGEGEKATSLMVSFGENSSVEIQNYFNADGTVAENHVNKFAIVTEQAGTKEYTLDWMHSNIENADFMYNVTSNTEKNLVEGIRNWVDGYTTEVVSITGKSAGDMLAGSIKDDTITASDGGAELFGDKGNDTLIGGAGNDYIWGGAGENTLTGGAGADTFDFTAREGGVFDTITDATKDDTIAIYGPNFKDMKFERGTGEQANDLIITVVGEGEGIGTGDTLTVKGYFAQEEADRVTKFRVGGELYNLEWKEPSGGTAQMYNMITDPNKMLDGIRNWLDGTNSTEAISITGTANYDTIIASKWNDTIHAGVNGSYIDGGAGSDDLFGSDSSDYIVTGSGSDFVQAGAGNDTIVVNGNGTKILYGGNGADTFFFEEGSAILFDATSDDKIQFKTFGTTNIIFTKDETDIVISSNSDNDTIRIRNYFNSDGTVADNHINKFVIDGITYTFEWRLSNVDGKYHMYNIINGTEGKDTLDAVAGIRNWVQGYGEVDTITGGSDIDMLAGDMGNDIISATTPAEIYGGPGNDTLSATGGSSFVVGGSGNDKIDVSGENNTICFINTSEEDQLNFGNDIISGSSSNDKLKFAVNYGTEAEPNYVGYKKSDLTISSVISPDDDRYIDIVITPKNDNGTNVVTIKHYSSESVDDVLVLNEKGDGYETIYLSDYKLTVNPKKKTITGTENIDVINVNENSPDLKSLVGKNKTIKALGGDDVIYANKGNDKLYGGEGNNKFLFKEGDGVDTIYSDGGDDYLEFRGFTEEDLSTFKHSESGNDLVITYGDEGDKIVLKDFLKGGHSVKEYAVYDENGKELTTVDISKMADDPSLIELNAQQLNKTTVKGSIMSETIVGSTKNNTLRGGGGNDLIDAVAGTNKVYADSRANNGKDERDVVTVYSGTGNDTLNAGVGYDKFVFFNGHGNDTVVINSKAVKENTVDGKTTGTATVLDFSKASNIAFTEKGNNLIITNTYPRESGMTVTETTTLKNYLKGSYTDFVKIVVDNTGIEYNLYDYLSAKQADDGSTLVLGNIDGTKNQKVTGSFLDETLVGGFKNDTIKANGGIDTLYGNDGNDKLYGYIASTKTKVGKKTVTEYHYNDLIAQDNAKTFEFSYDYNKVGEDVSISGDGKDTVYNAKNADRIQFVVTAEGTAQTSEAVEKLLSDMTLTHKSKNLTINYGFGTDKNGRTVVTDSITISGYDKLDAKEQAVRYIDITDGYNVLATVDLYDFENSIEKGLNIVGSKTYAVDDINPRYENQGVFGNDTYNITGTNAEVKYVFDGHGDDTYNVASMDQYVYIEDTAGTDKLNLTAEEDVLMFFDVAAKGSNQAVSDSLFFVDSSTISGAGATGSVEVANWFGGKSDDMSVTVNGADYDVDMDKLDDIRSDVASWLADYSDTHTGIDTAAKVLNSGDTDAINAMLQLYNV